MTSRGDTTTATVQQINRGVPADLKEAIRQEVERQESNQNDVAVTVLARHFDVPFEPSGIRSAGVGDSLDLVFKMPIALRRRIKQRATAADSNQRDVVVKVLCDHFGIRFATAPRRPRSNGQVAA